MHKASGIILALAFMTAPAWADSADDKVAAKNFEICRTKLKMAKKIDVLYDLQWKKGQEPTVVVGPIFFTSPFDAKEGFADTVNCFVNAGDTRNCTNFSLLDYQTHHEVARYSGCHLSVN